MTERETSGSAFAAGVLTTSVFFMPLAIGAASAGACHVNKMPIHSERGRLGLKLELPSLCDCFNYMITKVYFLLSNMRERIMTRAISATETVRVTVSRVRESVSSVAEEKSDASDESNPSADTGVLFRRCSLQISHSPFASVSV